MALQTYDNPPAARRRFARIPHDREATNALQAFCAECSPYRAIEYLLPELERGSFLAHGRYQRRCCATLTRDGTELPDEPTAVSGWGGTAAEALVALAFNWTVLMRCSWLRSQHVPLVSEVA